jgi:hypothetical protein
MFKKWFVLLPILALICGVGVAAYLNLHKTALPSTKMVERGESRGKEQESEFMSLALKRHIEQIEKTTPGSTGELGESVGGYEAEKLRRLAYPKKDIHLKQMQAARASFQRIEARSTRGAGPTWTPYGPDIAKAPQINPKNTSVYTPAKYFASGRATSVAISSTCTKNDCRMWIGAAGGGIWRTDKAVAKKPVWTFLSNTFDMNTIGSITIDPNDATGNTLYVGTGEANSPAGDALFGVGIYKSIDGGDSWTGPLGAAEFAGRAVGTIVVKPGDAMTIYAGSTRAFHGYPSVPEGIVSTVIPGASIWGLYKSIDGGTTWNLIHNGAADLTGCSDPATVATNTTNCSPRGVRRVAVDPSDPNVIYASSYDRGIWRSPDQGMTWTQIYTPVDDTGTVDRAEFAVTLLPGGATRMYVGDGNDGFTNSAFLRSDDVRTGTPTFTDLTSNDPADPGFGSSNYCTGQCWYDNRVYTPPGFPDIVYLSGSYSYNENDFVTGVSNGRGLVLSQDAGVSFTDQSYDATGFLFPKGLHPDHHDVVTNPNNPLQWIEVNDGGVWRSSGTLTSRSGDCAARGYSGTNLTRCQQLLSAIPTKIFDINKGLNTLQFQSLSVSPFNSKSFKVERRTMVRGNPRRIL